MGKSAQGILASSKNCLQKLQLLGKGARKLHLLEVHKMDTNGYAKLFILFASNSESDT